jgi:hypothetical protein
VVRGAAIARCASRAATADAVDLVAGERVSEALPSRR